jgi:hypothetical protein
VAIEREFANSLPLVPRKPHDTMKALLYFREINMVLTRDL